MSAVQATLPDRDSRSAGNGHNHPLVDIHVSTVVANPLTPGQVNSDDHSSSAGGHTLPSITVEARPVQAPSAASLSDLGRDRRATHTAAAGADLDGDQPSCEFQPSPVAVNSSAEFALGMAAATLSDIEQTRMALNNRVKAMEREGIDGTSEYATLKAIHDGMGAIEHQATLALQRSLRKHPLGPWVKRTVGIGEKQGARLIAAIGDPYWNALDDRPRRGPAELWAYCGYAPGQKRRKGVKSNWNADAKMRAFLIAESCIKQMHSPYRVKYDAARAAWADRDTSDGHKHNHALRVVAKEVLKDMFLEARRLAAAQSSRDDQSRVGGGNYMNEEE